MTKQMNKKNFFGKSISILMLFCGIVISCSTGTVDSNDIPSADVYVGDNTTNTTNTNSANNTNGINIESGADYLYYGYFSGIGEGENSNNTVEILNTERASISWSTKTISNAVVYELSIPIAFSQPHSSSGGWEITIHLYKFSDGYYDSNMNKLTVSGSPESNSFTISSRIEFYQGGGNAAFTTLTFKRI